MELWNYNSFVRPRIEFWAGAVVLSFALAFVCGIHDSPGPSDRDSGLCCVLFEAHPPLPFCSFPLATFEWNDHSFSQLLASATHPAGSYSILHS